MSELSVYDLNSRENWQKLLDETQSSLGTPNTLTESGQRHPAVYRRAQ